MTTNSRAEALKNAFGCSGSSRPSWAPAQSTSFGWQQQRTSHRRDRPYATGNRISNTTPQTMNSSRPLVLPTHSSSSKPVHPKNNRLDFLDKPTDKPLKKTGFVAMPDITIWNKGYRPAWMLSATREPPEKFEDGMKMYKTYMETGEVVYPKKVFKGNTAKQTATLYMNNYSNSKKVKKRN